MKNRNIQFKATALLLLGCVALLFAASPAKAGNLVPFNGTVSGYVESAEAPVGCLQTLHVVNFGNANQLGAFTGTAEFIVNVCDGTYTGFFNWTAANGDTSGRHLRRQLTPSAMPGVFDNHENAIVTGGTGASPAPAAILSWAAKWTSTRSLSSSRWQGTISSVGSNKKP